MGTSSICNKVSVSSQNEMAIDNQPLFNMVELNSEETGNKSNIQERQFNHADLYQRMKSSRREQSQFFSSNMLISQFFSQIIQSDQFPLGLNKQENEPFVHENVRKVLKRIQPFNRLPKDYFSDCLNSESYFQFEEGYYQGQWSHSIRNGFGKFFYNDGALYEGYWVNDVRHGQGRLINCNGDTYEGSWFADQQFGDAKFIHFDESVYIIPDINKQKVLKLMKEEATLNNEEKGFKYYGKLKNGLRTGFGVYVWNNGSRYEGQFSNDNINGLGKMIFTDSSIYIGMWFNAKQHGLGEIYYQDGKYFIGNFEEDKKTGYGFIKWPDGRQYRGQLVNGKMEGIGRFFDKKGRSFDGQFRDGKPVKQRTSQSNIVSQIQVGTPNQQTTPIRNQENQEIS